jgi:hypothetical protein
MESGDAATVDWMLPPTMRVVVTDGAASWQRMMPPAIMDVATDDYRCYHRRRRLLRLSAASRAGG